MLFPSYYVKCVSDYDVIPDTCVCVFPGGRGPWPGGPLVPGGHPRPEVPPTQNYAVSWS